MTTLQCPVLSPNDHPGCSDASQQLKNLDQLAYTRHKEAQGSSSSSKVLSQAITSLVELSSLLVRLGAEDASTLVKAGPRPPLHGLLRAGTMARPAGGMSFRRSSVEPIPSSSGGSVRGGGSRRVTEQDFAMLDSAVGQRVLVAPPRASFRRSSVVEVGYIASLSRLASRRSTEGIMDVELTAHVAPRSGSSHPLHRLAEGTSLSRLSPQTSSELEGLGDQAAPRVSSLLAPPRMTARRTSSEPLGSRSLRSTDQDPIGYADLESSSVENYSGSLSSGSSHSGAALKPTGASSRAPSLLAHMSRADTSNPIKAMLGALAGGSGQGSAAQRRASLGLSLTVRVLHRGWLLGFQRFGLATFEMGVVKYRGGHAFAGVP